MKKSLARIDYSKKFIKQLRKAPLSIKRYFRQKSELFLNHPFHPQLNNHALTGKFKGYRSINITGDWRAIYSEEENLIIFKLLGTHSQLYK